MSVLGLTWQQLKGPVRLAENLQMPLKYLPATWTLLVGTRKKQHSA
jgi:hypothetical protein